MLWPKTSLSNQQILLELLWILIYAFMDKSKPKLGNDISDSDKIMINSPRVRFRIT
jgi:hypothetical protein